MVLLELKDVWKSFDGTQVLKGVNVRVENGSLAVLLGPSGCGKTTTLKIIAGLLKPDKGRVYFDSRDVTYIPPRTRNVGMVFQTLALFPHLTVEENIAYGLKARRWNSDEIRRRVKELVDLFHLNGLEKRLPRELSGGQQQRVALARAIAPNPRLLLLDEPLRNLDANLKEELLWEIKRLQAELGITTIYVTHDQQEAFQLADKILIMHEGNIVQQGNPEEIYSNPLNSFVASFLGFNILKVPYEKRGRLWLYKLSSNENNVIVKNKRGLLAIRPEDLVLADNPTPPYLEGKVIVVSYSKLFYRVKAATSYGNIEFITRDRLKKGIKVKLGFDQEKVLILKE